MTKDIIITNKNGEVFNLYFKNILDLNEDEFEKLTAKLSDINQFKNENGKGIFYKSFRFNQNSNSNSLDE